VIRVEPSGVELEVGQPITIMAAANEAGYRWPTVCGGQGSCVTCFVRVLAGPGHLSAPSLTEIEGLAKLQVAHGDEVIRLACQARVEGDVIVFKRGVRRG
jgi:2Fe-2S ferredoxin